MRWFLAVVFAVLIGTILPDGARAQCSAGLITNCPPATNLQPDDVLLGWQSGQNPHTRKFPVGNIVINSSVPWIQASAYGVKADGVTSNDQALGLALYACAQAGTKLLLPPGQILLTGAALHGNATRLLQNCSMEGAGVLAGAATTGPSLGTVFLLTSTSVVPFFMGEDFAVEGINFYWPGQTGAVVYPPLFSGDGNHVVGHAYFHNVVIINAYDGVVQSNYNVSSPCPGTYAGSSCPEFWGDVKFDNYETFAVNDNFRLNSVGDGLTYSNMRVIPGAWLNMGGNATYVGTAASTSRVWHLTVPQTPGSGVNIAANAGITVVGARYGFLVDNGATMAEGEINAVWDSVGTIIDTSGGGTWFGFGVQFTGVTAGCQTPATTWGSPNGGQAPCFNMGSAAFSELVLTDFHSAGSQGDFITTAGTDVILTNSESLSIGSILATNPSAGDFYQLHITASGTPHLRIQNNRLTGGVTGVAHLHGITTTGSGVPSLIKIEGNDFEALQDAVNISFPQGATVANNTSTGTNGSVSFIQANTNAIIYGGNSWDKSPLATVSSCGTSPSAVSGGSNAGHWTTGTGTVNSCVFTLPITMFGGCAFTPSNAISVGAAPSGAPQSWTLSFSQGASPISSPSMNIFYSCPGQQ